MIIKLRGDVEENPGPQHNSCQSFYIFDWNLNSICAHNFIKLSLLCVYIAEINVIFDVSLKLF